MLPYDTVFTGSLPFGTFKTKQVVLKQPAAYHLNQQSALESKTR